ncbi:Na+/H+ antiporter NhaC family protein [Romboutsia ilealis]|uniref:Na+/H+ antiporter NhaC family protein n=1 Tax=Romboutsia faecis TaxID=2764597 RepID=A0ABR7JRH7_9FIRM|nr:Na+/H+ antiporter NhaC family protein [Romboutsia faecis]MBC5997387.1 Na+/H+ antiporter NhaC family protein [Romboutsia faecis]MRN23669.1 Na+/H+ antiporter NhaC family protein [Romboutsia ilealis]
MKNERKKGSLYALLPLAVFLLLFVGSGIITGDFYKMPVLVAFIISTAVALLSNRKESMNKKMDVFCKGAGNSDIISMCIIFLLAGAFGTVTKTIGGVDSIVNLSLSILPANLVVVGLFLIGCFISLSMGTSVGTIAAIAPIGIGVAEATGIPVALVLGAVVGGAMFGDNLSMISDTTIAAVRTQGCELKDKFKVNFSIVLPAAIITVILIAVKTSSYNVELNEVYTYELIKIVPYLVVLIGALLGINVFVLLSGGTIFASLVGIYTGSFDLFGAIESINVGMSGMFELSMISITIGGLVELIKLNGGIDFILYFISGRIKSKKGAEIGIAALASIVDLCTANNTIAIVMAGPLAKNISDEFKIDPRRSASILDIFSACWQGIIPYGAQLLTAAGLVAISPVEIIPYLYYPGLMGIFGILAILFGVPKLKSSNTSENIA